MKQPSNTRKRMAQRILSSALSLTLLLTGLVFAPVSVQAAGTATTHYEFHASLDPAADFDELQPNLTAGEMTAGEKTERDSLLRSTVRYDFFYEDGVSCDVTLFKITNAVGTQGPNPAYVPGSEEKQYISYANGSQVMDPAYHYGLTKYKTYCSNDYYTTSATPTYFKAAAESLALIPQSFTTLNTSDIGAANLSFIIACPRAAGGLNVAFKRTLEVKVSLDGETWLEGSVGVRSSELLAGGVDTEYQLFRIETDNLLSITGVNENPIKAIKILPEGEKVCSRSAFYLNQILVNTYATTADFNRICPEEQINYYNEIEENTLRHIVLAEAFRTAQTAWKTNIDFYTVSATGSSSVTNASNTNQAKLFSTGTSYRGPIYDRETDVARERFWSQFDIPDESEFVERTMNHVALGENGALTSITVSAPAGLYYNEDDLVFTKTYSNVKLPDETVMESFTVNQPFGMDCQAFVFNAISRVSRTSAAGAASTLYASRTSLVGDLETDYPLYTDADIIQKNIDPKGTTTDKQRQAIYASYAAAKPGDIAVHNLSNIINNVHTRLVKGVKVVYNNDGSISGNSVMYLIGQEGSPGSRDGGQYFSSAKSEIEATFAELADCDDGGSYAIFTLDEYATGLVEKEKVQTVFGPHTAGVGIVEGGLNIGISSNYRMISHQVTLQKKGASTKLYNSGLVYNEKEGSVSLNFNDPKLDGVLAALPEGEYVVNLTVGSGPFTAVDQIDVPTTTRTFELTVDDEAYYGDAAHSNHSGWQTFSDSITNGKYVLSSNVSETITIPSGVTATLCLNGKNIVSTSGPAIQINGGTLNLCSCGSTSRVTGASGSSGIVLSSGELNLYNGVLVTGSDHSGVIINGGVFNLYDGSILGNTNPDKGGGVYQAGGTFNMSGGTIFANTANTDKNSGWQYGGDGVYVNKGIFNLSGGVIANNTHKSGVCSGVYVYYTGVFNMTGGTLAGSSYVIYNISNGETPSTISGGKVSGIVLVSYTSTNSGRTQLELTGNVLVDGAVECGGKMAISGGSIMKAVSAGDSADISITGGKFSADTSREFLETYLPASGDYQLGEIADGNLKYMVYLVFGNNGAFIDFGSSLNVSIPLGTDGLIIDDGYEIEVQAPKQYKADFGEISGEGDSWPCVTIQGIAAKEMHDEITLIITNAGFECFKYTFSVYELAKEWVMDDENMVTMLTDMINYGIEAQKAFKYEPATEAEPLPYEGTSEAPSWTATPGVGVSDENQRDNVALTLSLKEKVQLNVYVNAPDANISNVTFDGKACVEGVDYTVERPNGKITRVNFHNIDVVNAKKAAEFTVTIPVAGSVDWVTPEQGSSETDSQVLPGAGFTVKYSIADYVLLALENGSSQSDLLIALQKYVDSVCEYLES